jgi:hypothetical protein
MRSLCLPVSVECPPVFVFSVYIARSTPVLLKILTTPIPIRRSKKRQRSFFRSSEGRPTSSRKNDLHSHTFRRPLPPPFSVTVSWLPVQRKKPLDPSNRLVSNVQCLPPYIRTLQYTCTILQLHNSKPNHNAALLRQRPQDPRQIFGLQGQLVICLTP